MKLRYTRRSVDDIARIADYIRAHNPAAAASIELAILSIVDLLSDFPLLGKDRPDLNARALGIPHHPFTVYYRIEGEEIWIVHIRDDRRKPIGPDDL